MPPPAGHTSGLIQTIAYDTAARVERVTTLNNNAYTRYVYGPNYLEQYSSVNMVADEGHSVQVFDGAGRAFIAAGNNPGSAGGYKAQHTQYDLMGRAVKQSNPADVNGSWSPVGPDDGAGWLYTAQTYDWKGRPRITTNTDGTQRSATYEGCGCAGGEVVTLTDEEGRQQKVYADALGRQWKTEVLNADGSVYSTATNTYNALDQVREVKEQAGTSGTAQLTTLDYDGYGRLHTRHLPRYDAGANVTYAYDADDVPLTTTDPRGVVTTYGFTNAAGYTNKRHLVNSVTYSNAPSGMSVPVPARFEYDAAGNRTQMTDGTGSVAYGYNALSQLTSEARQFTGLPGHTYTTTYDYTPSGQLKYVSEQGSSRVDYEYDAAGRTLNVTGSGPASSPSYASNMSYRAWGAVKDIDYGNNTHQFVGYDARLRAATMELRNVIVNISNQTPLTMKWDYDYYADGRVNHAYDRNDNRFDRKFDYDDKGRLKEAYTGLEARGQAPADPPNSPFRQTFGYDEWGNMTARSGRLWKQGLAGELSDYGTDDRRDGWSYDAAGNLTEGDSNVNKYDAAGSQTYSHPPAFGECGGYDYEIAQEYDGEGRPAKRVQTTRRDVSTDPAQPQCVTGVGETYYVYSAALGGAKLLELDTNGQKTKGYVYGGGVLLAKQEIYPIFGSSGVKWQHSNPGSTSWMETTSDRAFERQEMDPLGAEVGTADPFLIIPNPYYTDVHSDAPLFLDGGDPFHLADGCGDIGGMPSSCSQSASLFDIFGMGSRANFSGGSILGYGPRIFDPTNPPIDYAPDFADWIFRKGYENRSLSDLYDLSAEYQQEIDTSLDVIALRGMVAQFNTDQCKSFVKDLLTEAGDKGGDNPVRTDLLDLFDDVKQQGGFSVGIFKDETGAEVSFSMAEGAVGGLKNAHVYLSATSNQYPDPRVKSYYHASNTIGELTHVAGSKPSFYDAGAFSDVHLAQVAHKVAANHGKKYLPPPTLKPSDNGYLTAYSTYYHDILKSFCVPKPETIYDNKKSPAGSGRRRR